MDKALVGNSYCRSGRERRGLHWRGFFLAFTKTQRRRVRRVLDTGPQAYYSDEYSLFISCVALTTIVLCTVDAVLTLRLIEQGLYEFNPVAAWLLQQGVVWFFTLKFLITAVGVVVIMLHRQFKMFGVRGYHILVACMAGYVALVNYQVWMLL
ncbi:MAG: hypothetical protein HY080_08700 [Gammaproteobacteria bacterium]|nr:hypothetical protein [Gammaproteobacteria bacterium]